VEAVLAQIDAQRWQSRQRTKTGSWGVLLAWLKAPQLTGKPSRSTAGPSHSETLLVPRFDAPEGAS
jgi:hypothetical protein